MALNLQTEYQTEYQIPPKQSLDNIMPIVRMLPALDKLKLIQILAEDIGQDKDFFPFESGKTYEFPTPYDTYGAAEILLEGLAAYETDGT